MNIWANAVITDKGLALQSKLIEGITLGITRAVTAAGYVTPGLLNKQTDVTSPKQTLKFKTISYPEPGKSAVPVVLTNDDVTAGYTATQVGIYATDPDEGEILYFIAQAESGHGTVIPSKTEMPGYNAQWTFYFQYGQADGVNVTVDPSNTVSQAEMEEFVGGLQEEAFEKHNKDPETHPDIRASANLANAAIQGLLDSNIGTARLDITIPTTGWETDTIYPYHCDIAGDQVTADAVPLLTILPESMAVAQDCGMASCAQTLDGILRVYTETIPAEPIQASLALLGVAPETGRSES